jgi:Family of unknown function (DUF5681)
VPKITNGANGAGYPVGYRAPPIATQFQPGQSGNPKGRPKGSRNQTSMARAALERIIAVKQNGKRRKMTVRQAAFLQLAEKAGSGDLKALTYLLALEQREQPPGSDLHDAIASERALDKVQMFLERRRAAGGDKQ